MGNPYSQRVGDDDARAGSSLTHTITSADQVAGQDAPLAGKVLVMGDDTRGFLATVRSLGRKGIEVHAAPFNHRAPALASRYIAGIHDVPPWMADGSAWQQAMVSLLSAQNFDLVIPCDERNLLPLHECRETLAKLSQLAIPNPLAVDVLFDKFETRELALQVGVPVAEGRLARDGDSAALILAEFGRPTVVKPRRSYMMSDLTKRGRVHVTSDPAQLSELLAEAEPESLLLESCFEGEGLGVSVLAHEGRLLQAFEHHRVHERSGSSFYRVSAAPTPDLVEACAAIAGKVRFTGIAMFEFKRNAEGGWILLEVNARPWGSLPLPVALGVDFPFRWYELLVRRRETPPMPYRVGVYGRNLIPDLVSALADTEANSTRLGRAGAIIGRVAGTRRVLLGVEKNDVLVRDDKAPARAEAEAIIGRSVQRLRRALPYHCRSSAKRAAATIRLVAASAPKPNVLFLCQGNICRSPYAAAVLRSAMREAATVMSAGMMPRPGRPVPPLFRSQAAAEGIELAEHRSAWLDQDMLRSVSLIVLFDRVNEAAFAERYPHNTTPQILLGDLIGVGPIEDPVDQREDEIVSSYATIRRAVERLAQLLDARR